VTVDGIDPGGEGPTPIELAAPLATGIVLGGARVLVPGQRAVSWLDDAKKFPRCPKGRTRSMPPRFIVAHTVHGVRGDLLPGVGRSGRATSYARYQSTTTRDVSWDYTIDTDGLIVAHNDPAARYTWQAGHANGYSLGIELVQEADGDLYAAQMPAFVALCEALATYFSIDRFVAARDGAPFLGLIPAITSKGGKVREVRGVCAHANLTNNRGPGDPGPHPLRALLAAGWQPAPWAQR
jgi:hypothetical protein